MLQDQRIYNINRELRCPLALWRSQSRMAWFDSRLEMHGSRRMYGTLLLMEQCLLQSMYIKQLLQSQISFCVSHYQCGMQFCIAEEVYYLAPGGVSVYLQHSLQQICQTQMEQRELQARFFFLFSYGWNGELGTSRFLLLFVSSLWRFYPLSL